MDTKEAYMQAHETDIQNSIKPDNTIINADPTTITQDLPLNQDDTHQTKNFVDETKTVLINFAIDSKPHVSRMLNGIVYGGFLFIRELLSGIGKLFRK